MLNSLKKSYEFKSVYQYGKSYANKYLVLYVKNNNTNDNRLGISVSKKVGNSVVRHRITRLLRECYRHNEKNLEKGYDYVVVIRTEAKGKEYKEINGAFVHLVKLQKLWVNVL